MEKREVKYMFDLVFVSGGVETVERSFLHYMDAFHYVMKKYKGRFPNFYIIRKIKIQL